MGYTTLVRDKKLQTFSQVAITHSYNPWLNVQVIFLFAFVFTSSLLTVGPMPWYEDPYTCFSLAQLTNHTVETIEMTRKVVICMILYSPQKGQHDTFVRNFATCLQENGADPESQEVLQVLEFRPSSECWDVEASKDGDLQPVDGYSVCITLWRESEDDVQLGPDQILVCPVPINSSLPSEDTEVWITD